MKTYFDTGVILKLYTLEPESPCVRRFVKQREQPLHMNSLHQTECIAAFRLKAFRDECSEAAASRAIADFEEDIANRVLKIHEPDWAAVWKTCQSLLNQYASTTGCRTLDALHIACAQTLNIREFVTTDKCQRAMAALAGMRPISPLS
jgi:predicted nucleic acid-binding protein